MNIKRTLLKKIRPGQIGLSSFCYRYNFGFGQNRPSRPMTVLDLFNSAKELGINKIQLCENTGYDKYSDNKLRKLNDMARKLGLSIELGMGNLSTEALLRHLEIAKIFSAKFLRVVLGADSILSKQEMEAIYNNKINILKNILPKIREMGLSIGIENHFDLPSNELVRMVKEINDENIGLLFDSTNCLAFIERPEEVLELFKVNLLSIHLKDYIVTKVGGEYRFTPVPLGDGQQDIEGILISSLRHNPGVSIIIEMPVQGEKNKDISEMVKREKIAVKKCAGYLFKMINSLTANAL